MTGAVAEKVKDPQRLRALHGLKLLDTPTDQAFDRLSRLAARILNAPVALVSLVDRDRQFFKSCVGLPEPWSSWRETPLSHSFCQHVVASGKALIVPDARRDPVLLENLAIPDLGVVAYLGCPLVLPDGHVIGSFCVIDHKPRDWTDTEAEILHDIASSVMSEIELRNARDHLEARVRARTAELELTNRALRESEERYRDLVESSLDMICTHDLEGRLLSVNARACDLLGYTHEELIGRNLRDLIAPPYRDEFDSYLAEVRRAGVARGYLQVRTRSGDARLWYYENTLHTGVVPPIVRGTAHDVTQQREAEQKLRDSEAQFRELVELAADGIFVSDAQGRLTGVNQAGCKLVGYAREELLQLSLVDLMTPEDRRHDPPRLDALRTGKTITRERRLLRKDGTIVPVEIHVKQLPGGRIQGIVRDITERQLVERERETLLKQLMARNADMENFIYTISHDLKTPLVTIAGFASLLGKDMAKGDAAAARSSLDEIQKAVAEMTKHIKDLLLLSRIEHAPGEKKPVDLNRLIQSTLNSFKPRLEETRTQVRILDVLPTVTVDRKGFTRVFNNLLDNALKYRRPDVPPVIEIGAVRVDEELRLYVRDNGQGIKSEYQSRIFGLFQRADSRTEGTGVGLAISKRVVEAHGGRMWVESTPGEGSTFWIGLPSHVIAPNA